MPEKITQRNLPKFTAREKRYDVRDTDLTGFILTVHPTGRRVYYCEYGRGKREKLGLVPAITPEQARKKAETLLAGLTLGGETPVEARRKAKAHDLKGFIESEYGPWCIANRKSGAATVARIKATFFYDLADKKLSEITPWLIEKWRTARRKAGTKPTTINRDVVALRAAVAKAVEWNLLDAHPLRDIKPLKTDRGGVVRYLTADEERRLRAALAARDRRIVEGRVSGNAWRERRGQEPLPEIGGPYGDYLTPLVLVSMNTGMRRGEALALIWENVNLKTGILTVTGETAKSHQTRHIPLSAGARTVLTAWREQGKGTGLVFLARDGEALGSVKKAWAAVLADANIAGFRWHDLRHHFASRLVMAGADLYVVKELLGHSTISMTEKYAHLAPEHKQAAVSLLDGGR
jgi:integrase